MIDPGDIYKLDYIKIYEEREHEHRNQTIIMKKIIIYYGISL